MDQGAANAANEPQQPQHENYREECPKHFLLLELV
jgi:hypothetical protein